MRITTGWKHETIKAVELVDCMGDDDAICDAARVSFDRQASEFTPEQNGKLLKYLASHDHWSPFAHVSLKFRFKAPMFIALAVNRTWQVILGDTFQINAVVVIFFSTYGAGCFVEWVSHVKMGA